MFILSALRERLSSNKLFFSVVIFSALAVAAVFYRLDFNSVREELIEQQDKSDMIKIFQPQADSVIASPLLIEGEARGLWFFEASFPIRLIDENNKEIAVAIAQSQSDWMTKDFVPFRAVMEFEPDAAGKGYLVFQKDNPSGLPENDDEMRVPVFIGFD